MSKDHISKTRRNRKCSILDKEYDSIKDASIELKISRITLGNRIRDTRKEFNAYYYIN